MRGGLEEGKAWRSCKRETYGPVRSLVWGVMIVSTYLMWEKKRTLSPDLIRPIKKNKKNQVTHSQKAACPCFEHR